MENTRATSWFLALSATAIAHGCVGVGCSGGGENRPVLVEGGSVETGAARDGGAGRCQRVPTATKEPLDEKPRLLWTWTAPVGSAHGSPALAKGNRLGVSFSNRIYFFDAQGHTGKSWMNQETYARLSPPVADDEGNFYVATDTAVSLTASGQLRWQVPLREGDPHHGSIHTQPFLLSPDGILYSLQGDGHLTALNKDTSALVWRKRLFTGEARGGTGLKGGTRDTVVAVVAQPSSTTLFIDRGTGATKATYPGGQNLQPDKPVAGLGYIGESLGDGDVWAIGLTDGVKDLWSVQFSIATSWLGFVAVDLRGAIVIQDFAQPRDNPARPDRYRFYDCDGTMLSEPRDLPATPGRPFSGVTTMGADGTVYLIATQNNTKGMGSELYALAPDGTVKWRQVISELTFPPGDHIPRMPISETGVLYLVLQDWNTHVHVVAVQTTSPGLAATAYPIARVDNENRGWSGPLP